MKSIIQILLWIVSIGLGFLIYKSVMGPIEFKKTKEERFNKVISVMKDIGKSQEAYKSVNGKYAKDFNGLIKFIDTANYTITQQRDSSFMEFNKVYGIDMLKEIKIIDTLGTVSVKDSLFKKDNRYKTMMNVPFAKNGEKFTLAASAVERTGGYLVPVFEAKVKNIELKKMQQKVLNK